MSHQYFEKKENISQNVERLQFNSYAFRKKIGCNKRYFAFKTMFQMEQEFMYIHTLENKQQPANWIYLALLPWQNKRRSNVLQLKSNNNRKKTKNTKQRSNTSTTVEQCRTEAWWEEIICVCNTQHTEFGQ